MSALAVSEQTRLEELEHVVERGLTTFVEVGRALLEIRDQRLYRATHETFESYCEARWKFSASRGRQLIAAATIAGELESVTRVMLPSERHARALAPLVHSHGTEVAGRVWEEIAQSVKAPTVADVQAVVKTVQRGSPPAPTHPALANPAACPIFGEWLASLDPKTLAAIDAEMMVNRAADALIMGRELVPMPPTWEWDLEWDERRAECSRDTFRESGWDLHVMCAAGQKIAELKSLGLWRMREGHHEISFDRKHVKLEAARKRVHELVGDEKWTDEACVDAAIGHAISIAYDSERREVAG